MPTVPSVVSALLSVLPTVLSIHSLDSCPLFHQSSFVWSVNYIFPSAYSFVNSLIDSSKYSIWSVYRNNTQLKRTEKEYTSRPCRMQQNSLECPHSSRVNLTKYKQKYVLQPVLWIRNRILIQELCGSVFRIRIN